MQMKSGRSASPLRLGIIGTGRMAERMLTCASNVPGLSVTAIASSTLGRADVLTGPINAAACSSAEELAARHDVDAIYVATSAPEHAQGAMAAIAARKPVLVEKPFGVLWDRSNEIVTAARAAGVLLVENFWFLALPATSAMITRVEEAAFGAPLNLAFDFGYPVTRAAYSALHDPDLGVVRDRGIYGIALGRRLLGPVEELTAQGHWDGQTDLSAAVTMKHTSGALSQITVSFEALLSNTATVSCSGGMIRMDPSLGGDTLVMSNAPTQMGPAAKPRPSRLKSLPVARALDKWRKTAKPEKFPYGDDPHLPMLVHFCGLVRNGMCESPLAPLELSLDTQRLVNMARVALGAPS